MIMRKLLYILPLLLAVACIKDPIEDNSPVQPTGDPKVEIDFTVQVQDPSVATKSLAQKPKLRNLMVAVFDASGYLLEYTYATEIDLATENAKHYEYKVSITQSDDPRIIHFIGNAPDKLTFGVEETVLAEVTSSIGEYDDDGIYWCRREIPQISGTNSGGAMLLADDDAMEIATPIYQADLQTRAYFSNVGLIRNFSQIELKSTSADFVLEKYYVVGTPKEGLAAAYNYSTGKFVNYYKEATIVGDEDAGYTYNLGNAKTYAEIIEEGYDAKVLPTATRFTLAEWTTESNWVNDRASAFVYECEKPLRAEDAVYIIAYGTYTKENKPYYYKIDLRDANGYFPLIRNFKYTVDIREVTRAGYDTPEKAATSAGSGDISTSLETKSLAYISDGVASLEVEYVEKYIVTPDDVTLKYEFLEDVNTSTPGSPSNMWLVVNEYGATGAAIAALNGNSYTVGNKIPIGANPGKITISPTALTDVPKSQTLTIYAEYINDGASHILQRTVNYIVQSKRTMVVSLAPSQVPKAAGSGFDVNISLPAGLSKSIFPLEFLIESGSLSINPSNDQMPVRTGISLADKSKSSFYFVKTFDYSDYNPESGALNTVACHFKTIKAEAQTHIYAANSYFETEYDYHSTVSDLDADGRSVYLDTYVPSTFSMLSFSSDPVGVGEGNPVWFGFNMSRIPEDGVVYVALGNLQPAASETQLEYHALQNGKAVYEFRPQTTAATFALETAHFDGELSVDLSAYKFIPATETAQRSLYNFDGSFNKDYLTGVAETVQYTFYVPYYYPSMVIEVEMRGLAFNDGKLPSDWENWRNLGNDVYAVQYKPSGFLNAVTINLVTTITDFSEDCTISVRSQGYYTETGSISAVRDISIPVGNLVMSLPNTTTFRTGSTNSTDRRIYIYKEDGTLLTNYSYTTSSNNRTATNNSAITLNDVTYGTQIYVTYTRNNVTYKSTLFSVEEASQNRVSLTLRNN